MCSEIKLTPVTYNIDEQENIVREALKILLSVYNTHDISDDEKIRIIIELFDSFVLEMGCRFKHEKYKSEQEVRAILDLHETDLVYVRHRASNGIVIPYVPLKICPYSIEEIRISPTLQGRPAMSGLKSLKTIKKLTFDITQSEIPFRNI